VTTPMADPVHRARAYLLRVAEPPAPALAALIAQQGPVIAAARVRDGDVSREVAAETGARRHVDGGVVDDDFAQAATVGARLLTPEDEDWPTQCLRAHARDNDEGADTSAVAVAPIALWVRGKHSLAELLSSAVAVIGSRASTSYGDTVAADLGYGLSGHGITVVSDAAYGIGGSAVRGAFANDGLVVTVLANGIDVVYPAGHADLLRRVPDHGLLISEYPPGTVPSRRRFLTRLDRLALFSAGVVVVEAASRSGSCRATTSAQALGRTVMAVPGPITSTQSFGTHALLRYGTAVAVASADEIIETLGISRSGERRPHSTSHPFTATDSDAPCG
jgi:DNA processing protein